ncbi:Zn-ribbon domain-containing OB-fold protein [Streptomyces sp. NPDC093589]|uniref:Zn-ribbon domain-containing OB-fold protein n=1 Tax=Streptomyces sp. NPDC093589 TaxID=3366043 RepID=UPI003823C764
MSRTRTPVVPGWFDQDATDFRLLGTRCRDCGSVFFPREDTFCRNPGCGGGDLAEVPLSRRGTVWSYTDGRYRPPAPYPSDPDAEWQPYTLVAVELAAERMVVLGQAAPGVTVADLTVGAEVELVPGVLNEDATHTWTTWRWTPVTDSGAEGRSTAEAGAEAGERGAGSAA